MRQFKGTPGKWCVGAKYPNKSNVTTFRIDTLTGHVEGIAEIPEALTKEEGEANVNLIAEAPALLQACIQLIDSPHYEHFATRLNLQEMKGLDGIKESLIKILGE